MHHIDNKNAPVYILRRSLQIPAPFRIALSATVKPHYLGIIEKNIGKKIYSFDLKQAIEQGIIVPFKLIVYIVNLNQEEQGVGEGRSKQKAEQDAARNALDKISLE